MLPEAGATELIFLAAVALIVVGPKDLPVLMRKVGQWVAKMRGLAAEFRSSFDELARQSELDELRKEVEALRNARDPLADLHPTFAEVSAGLDPTTGKSEGDHWSPTSIYEEAMSTPRPTDVAVGAPEPEAAPVPEAKAAPKPRAPRKPKAAAESSEAAALAPKPRRKAAAKSSDPAEAKG